MAAYRRANRATELVLRRRERPCAEPRLDRRLQLLLRAMPPSAELRRRVLDAVRRG